MTQTNGIHALCEELKAYCAKHNLPFISADELLLELYSQEPRNEAHCAWVRDFIARWDEAV